ncbi:3-phenylpropionate/cinnamic acid dioxygenase ferredoxin subunit [Planctomycetes bacterium MalM25]|nr:3-phenylpropionate/cinnamic acid dioxygenase ferredoxin subunit [Planctomycetes bacterium MalM25]
MSDYESVGQISEFADPSSTLVEVDDEAIVLIHAAGRFYALDDVCTHDGGPLSDGPLDCEDQTPSIACPRHGAKFALGTGAALTMPATKPTRVHETKVEGDQVFVRLSE